MRYTVSSSPHLRSVRLQYTAWSVLLVAVPVTLPSSTSTASNLPTLTARAQTSGLLVSHASRPLLSNPELVPLRSAHACHYDLGNGR